MEESIFGKLIMYYRRGKVSTNRQWGTPNMNAIKSWYNSMKPVIESTNLDCNILGRCVYDINNTKDVDITYTGTITEIPLLEYLLAISVDIGFRYNILIDCKWANSTNTITDLKPNDTEFIFLNYYEQDDGIGTRVIRDFTLNPKYTIVGKECVRSKFSTINSPLKTHQIEYIKQYGNLPSILIQDFIKE